MSTELPLDLLRSLASKSEQVRFIVHGTKDEYLLPEELVNDARHFCERADSAIQTGTLSAKQISTTLVLKQAIEESGDFLDGYDRTNIGELVERDVTWDRLRRASQDVLVAFGDLSDGDEAG